MSKDWEEIGVTGRSVSAYCITKSRAAIDDLLHCILFALENICLVN